MVSPIVPLIELDGVTIRKNGKTILDAISASITGRGATMVMGPNGSGKTTFLRTMHGLERPKAGNVYWKASIQQAHDRQAFIFQTPTMMRRSVVENAAYPLRIRGLTRREALQSARDWLKRIGLAGAADREANVLSGGERQKLAMARALITEPEIVFLDEPTTNLDGRSTREIEEIMTQALDAGTRLVMATHDIGQAKRLADDVIFLNNGKIAEHSNANIFFDDPRSKAAQAYLRGDIVE